MKQLILKNFGLAMLIGLFVSPVWAAKFEENIHYTEIPFSESTFDGKQVEVREFFWYGCGHCYQFEPLLEKWLKNKPKSAKFVRTPAFPNKIVHARSYYAFEAMGIVDGMHGKVFEAIHAKHNHLESVDEVADLVKANGFDAGEFMKQYKSFSVDSNTRQAFQLGASYGVRSVPTVVVDGRFVVSASTAGSHERVLQVIDYLVDRISKSKK
ncbi:MAG: thiol:disulfide interchange protein DsbA/DsbL [Gammaproteobacteria bacterium]|nr:thiol:disulfide interchange protein DsbA/DsbL [Gammaproteobacteria bacterium]